MIKSVDLFEVKGNSLFKFLKLTFYIIFLPVTAILLTFLNHYHFMLMISFVTIAIIVSQFFLSKELHQNDKKMNYATISLQFMLPLVYVILVWRLGLSTVSPGNNKNILTLVVLGYLPIFFIINSEVYLREIKSILYNNFVKRKKLNYLFQKMT